MSDRAAMLAAQFEEANDALVTAIESFSDEDWRVIVPGENWAVGVVAHHIVDSWPLITDWIESLSRGEEAVYDHDAVDAHNAEHAREYAGCTQSEAASAARRDGATVARLVANLSDAQLDTVGTFQGNPRTPTQLIERVLIGHTRSHLGHIQAALAEEPSV
jgi:uncharacterized damage-inducible protein DinB